MTICIMRQSKDIKVVYYSTNPMHQPLSALNLRANFHAVAEGEHHSVIRIDRCVINLQACGTPSR